ncbi:uncharacterized protein [Typha angustifolia]|uniref:uncharacterized protein n=1 Tax=Typha angustifolia TaxID=59011 RepID=UPI003C2EFD09
MASSSKIALSLVLSLSLSLFFPSALGGVICEDLPQKLCAFSISSTSRRCVLESVPHERGTAEYQCHTSDVVVAKMSNWIESDECVKACGVYRSTVGISSDALLEPQFMAKLCSDACYKNCPNIVDLYFNLAAGEGVFLPELCKISFTNPHRSMKEVGSGAPAPAPAP